MSNAIGQPNISCSAVTRVIRQASSHVPTLGPAAQTYKCSVIVNEFCHELSALCSPTALFPTDSMSSQRRALPPLSSQQTLESDDYSDFPPIRILKSPEIVNEFCHELSALCSPTAPPTDSRISTRRLLRFSPHPSTQDPRDCE